MISILRCCTGRLQMTPVTTIFRRPYIKVSNKMEILLKQADQIPRQFELIYRYPTYRMAGFMFHAVNWVSITTFTIVAYEWYMDRPTKDDVNGLKILNSPIQAALVGCCAAAIIYITWTVRGRCPMRVYYNPDGRVYRAIFLGKIPYSTEYHEFQKGTVSYVSKNSFLPWSSTLFEANGRKMLLYEDYFRTGGDLVDMFKTEKK